MAKRVELGPKDVLVYKGFEIDQSVLEAITAADARLLWAFVHKGVDVQAVCYTEERVIWMSNEDVLQPDEVEL